MANDANHLMRCLCGACERFANTQPGGNATREAAIPQLENVGCLPERLAASITLQPRMPFPLNLHRSLAPPRIYMTCSRSLLPASLVLAITLCPGTLLHAQQPDNSAQNKNQSTTADKQPNAQNDRTITAQVRKAIIADKDLSTYGHNVKIITVNGAVTLKGPVKSDDEKQKIASDAGSVIGADKITNQLTVKQ
jgi:hyperosmotically inducible protein